MSLDRKQVTADGIPTNPLYSQALVVNNMVYLSGVTGVDPATGSLVDGSVGGRTSQILKNISHILKAAGSDISKTVRVNMFLTDMSDYTLTNEAYAQVFNQAIKPVRTCVAVKELPRATDVEIEVTATYESG